MSSLVKAVCNLGAVLLVGYASTALSEAQTRFAVTDLGVLPGSTLSAATGLSDRGDVVGACAPSPQDSNEVGFVWRNGIMTSTGKLPGGLYSEAHAINSLGVVVGDGDTGNGRPQSWATGPAGLINIFPNNGGNTHAIAINDSGAICGYYTKSLSGNASSWKAAIWTPDPKDPRKYRTTVLPILVGLDPTSPGTTAIPQGFNQSGQAAGYASNEIIGQHACFWNNDAGHSIVDLGVFPGDWSSLGLGMNDLGQVVGESHPPFSSRPVMWDNDAAHTPYALPLLPGDNYGAATAINRLGQALGRSAWAVPGTWNVGPARLVFWNGGEAFDLQNCLDPATGAGWTLITAAAINNNGQIVGLGIHNGLNRAYLLTPIRQ
jgi:uncharacterized membrane protein